MLAGKHCFVEKPLATTAADAELAVDAAAQAGTMLMVGHLLEYHPGGRPACRSSSIRMSWESCTTSTATA